MKNYLLALSFMLLCGQLGACEMGYDSFWRCDNNEETLFSAAISGKPDKVKSLLGFPYYACANTNCSGSSILETAHSNCVKILLEAGAPFSTKNRSQGLSIFGSRLYKTVELGLNKDQESKDKFKEEKEAVRAFLVTKKFKKGLTLQQVQAEAKKMNEWYKSIGSFTQKDQLFLATVVEEVLKKHFPNYRNRKNLSQGIK